MGSGGSRLVTPVRLDHLPKHLRDQIRAKLAEAGPSRERKPNKYGALPTELDGYTFASRKEARYYEELRQRERAGEVTDIVLQPRYDIIIKGVYVGRMTLDFAYRDVLTGLTVIVDVKGGKATRTEAYSLRKRVVEALHGIKIEEA